jgi:hypothetical protein
MAQATKRRTTKKVNKKEKQEKDEMEITQPASETEPGRSGERSYGQDDEDVNNKVMGEREEASQDGESDAERIERRTSSRDSGEDDYAEDTDEDHGDSDEVLRKNQDTYADEDQAEGEDDESEDQDERRSDR